MKLTISIKAGPKAKKSGNDITNKFNKFFLSDFIIEDIIALFIQYIHVKA